MGNGEGTMEEQIQCFIAYLRQVKILSDNTILSYQRDLRQLERYLERERGIRNFDEVSADHLKEYFQILGREKKASSVSRCMSTVRALYRYMTKMHMVKADITEQLRTPKQDREIPEALNAEEIRLLVEQPSGDKPRQQRDRAILELLYATGIRVSELIALRVSDVNLKLGFLHCREGDRERVIPFGNHARAALLQYLDQGRETLLSDARCDILFVNYSGMPMSRQGVWKLVRRYGEQAGIQKEVTPHSLRYAFSVHLIENGADLRSVQEMMGYTDITAIQVHGAAYRRNIRKEYAQKHPRE